MMAEAFINIHRSNNISEEGKLPQKTEQFTIHY